MFDDELKMDDATKADLAADKLTSWFKSYGITGPWKCLACGAGIRKARYLKATTSGGRRFATLTWCSQECVDRWAAQFKTVPTRWEKYNASGELIGYVVPRKHFISLQEIEEAELAAAERGTGE